MTRIDIGWVVGLVVAIVVFAAVALGFFAFRTVQRDTGSPHWAPADDTEIAVAKWLCAVVAALILILYPFIWWPPFNMEYHSFKLVGGEIAQIESRLLAGSEGGATQNYVVVFDGSDQEYRCDDSRCATVAEGDELWLWCTRVWLQASTPGWVCNFDRAVRTP